MAREMLRPRCEVNAQRFTRTQMLGAGGEGG
jgi:hypothetical protein